MKTTQPSMPTLEELQHLMQTAIQHPQRVRGTFHNIINTSYGIGADQRLAIYQRGYILRLLECMRAEYPQLIKAFSADWFDTMAQHYLASHPSSSTNLNDLGARFPDFLQQDRPDKQESVQDDAFDFLISLATLERFRTETSRGKGSENADFNQFSLLETQPLDSLKIELAPNLRLLKSPFQLVDYLTQLNQSDNANNSSPELIKQTQHIAICRENYRTQYFIVKPWQFDLLVLLQHNTNLNDVLQQINQQYADSAIYGFAPFFLLQAASKGCIRGVCLVTNK